MSANETPAKSLVKGTTTAANVSSEPAVSPTVTMWSGAYADDAGHNKDKQVQASKQKLDELAGRHAEEPLLKENPGRFVLFPIMDNEVSALIMS